MKDSFVSKGGYATLTKDPPPSPNRPNGKWGTPLPNVNMKNKSIKFQSDRVKVSGPRVDGNYTVTFEVGEYEWEQIKELPGLNGKNIKVQVDSE